MTLANLKGGVGKSNGAFALAGEYSRLGLKTLCCDMDAQGSLSSSFLGAATVDKLPKAHTVATVFDRHAPPARVSAIIRPSGVANIDLIPANLHLAEYNVQVANAREVHLLRQFLANVDGYDVCIVDTPPSMQFCSVSAMVASDWVLAPVQVEEPAVQGISHLLRTLNTVQAQHNPRVRLGGYIVTLYDRRLAVHRAYEQMLRDQYKELVFLQQVPLASAFKEAVVQRVPVTLGAPRTSAARAIRALVAEMDARMTDALGGTTDGEG